jgi:thiol-disulfide isomerase/thioredoxin
MRIQLRNFNLLAACLCCIAAISPTVATAGLKTSNPFPDLATFKLEGALPSDLKGKIVIVDFWASWCLPCKASFPVMDALQKKYGRAALVILAVNEDAKKADMEAFLKDKNLSFAIVRDAAADGHKLVDKVEIDGMPSSFVIDSEGVVRFIHSGFHGNDTRKAYEKEIESLLPKSK